MLLFVRFIKILFSKEISIDHLVVHWYSMMLDPVIEPFNTLFRFFSLKVLTF